MGYICKVVGANEFFNVTTEMIKTSQSSDTIFLSTVHILAIIRIE